MEESSAQCWSAASSSASSRSNNSAATICVLDELLCREGSGGPLCGRCDSRYVFNAALRRCVHCQDWRHVMPFIIGILALAAFGLFLVCLKYDMPHRAKELEQKVLRSVRASIGSFMGSHPPPVVVPTAPFSCLPTWVSRLRSMEWTFFRALDRGSVKVLYSAAQVRTAHHYCSRIDNFYYTRPSSSIFSNHGRSSPRCLGTSTLTFQSPASPFFRCYHS